MRIYHAFRFFAAILLAACWAVGQAQAQSAPAVSAPTSVPDVDLKLFETSEVDRSKGCTVALWQNNRDPDADKFAYIFIEQLTGRNNARQPARIKIAGQSVNITRVATGGKNNGYNLFEYQLYKLPAEDEFVILQLKLGELMGETVEVESGTLSVVQKGRQVFRASVKGGAGCMTAPIPAVPSAPAPRAATVAPVTAKGQVAAGMFERYEVRANEVPRAMVQAAIKQFGCEAAAMRKPVVGYQMSEESALWQLSCGDYGNKNVSVVYALVYIPEPGKQYSFVPLTLPKGINRALGEHALMDPKWDMKSRTVTGIHMEGNGTDCGQYERYQVTEDGAFKLVEFRMRDMCDGKRIRPEEMPLVFPKR